MKHSEASLEQRRRNVEEIAKRRRMKGTCKWGHREWTIRRPDGRRKCKACARERMWYYKRGLSVPPGGPA